MTTFFTSDLHLGHRRLILYMPGRNHYLADPTVLEPTDEDVQRMTDDLINRYNARVTDNDTVYILGDVCMGPKDKHRWYISRLKGRKILVIGNHDKYKNNELFEVTKKRFMDYGFSYVAEEMYLDTEYGKCYLRHIPDPDFKDATYMLHGHVHSDYARIGNLINVGVDVRGYSPKTLKELLDP